MTAGEMGIWAGTVFTAFMGTLSHVKHKRIREELATHVNGTPVKVERMRIAMIKIADAWLASNYSSKDSWAYKEMEEARDELRRLPLLTAAQYRAAQGEE